MSNRFSKHNKNKKSVSILYQQLFQLY